MKLMSDVAVAEHCRLFRPIPLYLQQAILAVPDNIRNNPYTDLPNVSKNNYVAPQSVNVMASNAQTFFNVSPTSFVGAYNKLVNKELATNENELDHYYGINELFREYEGFYRAENAFAGVGGGGEMFQTLADADMSATILASEQNVARQAGTGLIKAKRGRPDEMAGMSAEDFDANNFDLSEYSTDKVMAREAAAANKPFQIHVKIPKRDRSDFMNSRINQYEGGRFGELIAKSMQSSSIPGLVTQTRIDEPGVEESKESVY
tara:strand:- start:55 stop:840 length:786 start_codon:yes stop_codon:yes gene_type:complete